MKIIVCGAGEIGSNIAKQLVYEDNDVTIIDESESLLRSLNKSLDLKSIYGKPSHPEILEKAGADEADMIIAVSDSDELNIISCEMANHLFKIPLKVARIKEAEYLRSNFADKLFSSGKIDVDAIISPELEVAKDIIRKLNTPGAFDSFYLGNKTARIIGISINETCPSFSLTNASPSEAVLLIFFDALAIPFFLKNSIDFSKSPLLSSTATLQSLNPTPVISLNFFILLSKSFSGIR